MLGQPIQWSHVAILAKAYFRYAIRGGSGLIFLLVFLVIALGTAGIMIDPLKQRLKTVREDVKEATKGQKIAEDEDELDKKVEEAYLERMTEQFRPVVVWLVDAEEPVEEERVGPFTVRKRKTDPFVEHLIVERPPILSAYLMILLMFIPFTTCIGAFNQLSGDIGTKGLRYLLLRTERINIIVARFLGTLLFAGVTSLICILIVVLYLRMTFDTHGFGELLTWGLRGWVAAMVLSLPYLCLCTLLSSAIDTPIATLFVCLMIVGLPIIVINLTQTALEQMDYEEVGWLDRLTPWGWKFDLLHNDFGTAILAYLIMLVFSAAFGFLAVRHFLRRDL